MVLLINLMTKLICLSLPSSKILNESFICYLNPIFIVLFPSILMFSIYVSFKYYLQIKYQIMHHFNFSIDRGVITSWALCWLSRPKSHFRLVSATIKKFGTENDNFGKMITWSKWFNLITRDFRCSKDHKMILSVTFRDALTASRWSEG